jgi:hypothetical protein
MTKITARDIKSSHVLSASPLVLSVTHTDGSSDSYSLARLLAQMTDGAQAKARELAGLQPDDNNHPSRNKTYYRHDRRGFANEYSLGIATSKASRQAYEDAGYARQSKADALKDAARPARNGWGEESFIGYTIDGTETYRQEWFALARNQTNA